MKIILMSVGTRGDMEPFLALGGMLRDKGHQVICAFPGQFRDLAEDARLEFYSLGQKYIQLLDSEDGKAAMGGGGSGLEKFMATVRLARNQGEANQELAHRQRELVENIAPDRIIYNGKSVYPLIWSVRHRGRAIMLSSIPYMHYVKDHAHVVFNRDLGPFLNKLTYQIADFGLVTTTMVAARWLGLAGEITRKEVKSVIGSNKTIYMISPALFSRPETWGDNLKILGYQQRQAAVNWQPDQALLQFLDSHARILFITFGSMTNPEPEQKTRIILDILERNQVPAVINTASGGLVEPAGYASEWVHFVPRIPYDWILPRVYGVIHHGGSGTTHLALKNGCATMVIPHIIDQFVWDRIVADKGAGPKGVKIGAITSANLEPKILELFTDSRYKTTAQELAAQMSHEDFKDAIYKTITEG